MAEERSRAERYLLAAVLNPWGLAAVAGAFSAALVTGDAWIAGVGMAVEAAWISVAARSPRFRRAVDARTNTRAREQSLQKTRDELALLAAHERSVAQGVATAAAEVRTECLRNPSLGAGLLGPELDRLEDTIADYVHLALVAQRCEAYLARADPRKIDREREDWRKQAEQSPDDAVRALAARNVEVLEKRLRMVEEIRRFAGRARTQMSLVQNTVALLRDQVLTISTPEAVTQELEALVSSLDALREATREVESVIIPPAASLAEGNPTARPADSEAGSMPAPPSRVRT